MLRGMVAYRRNRQPGGMYFFTVTLQDRGSDLLTRHISALGASMRETRRRHPFDTVAMVVLPDHLHALWRLPENETDYSTRWRLIKSGFTRRVRDGGVSLPTRGTDERALWARRFWEHTIRDEQDLLRHVDYIHGNPVKHGWVERMDGWPWSTIHRYQSTARSGRP